MNFLYPIWLLSVIAISIPVFIHLWNVRPGKTLKVGSIAFIDTSSRKRGRSLSLLELLLLLSRCLLLNLLALVLAMPYFKNRAADSITKGWLLIPKGEYKEAYQNYKHKTDSLVNKGYELHYFNPGFQKTTVIQASADTVNLKAETAIPYWNLLKQLNARLPASIPVYIITTNTLNNFEGSKPTTPLQLHWLTYTPKDSTANWMQRAWFTENKDIHVVSGNSKPSGTAYHSEDIKQSAIENSPYELNISNGKPFISIKNSRQKSAEIDTSNFKIDIFDGANAPDAGYVIAALQSIIQFTRKNIAINAFNSKSTTKKNWLFCLAGEPLDKATISRYNNILVYENGKTEIINSSINTAAGKSAAQVIPLYKYVTVKTYPGETEWANGYGDPVLTVELKGNTQIHHFYSRFNPAWNNLVWDEGFPKIMLQLIGPLDDYPDDTPHDKRTISSSQLRPGHVAGGRIMPGIGGSTTDMSHYFWLSLVLILITERWLAHKSQLKR